MSEIGGELGEFAFDIESGTVPVDQRAGGKPMAHVQKPGAAAMPRGLCAETQLLRDLCERVASHAICDSSAALGNEKRGSLWRREDAVSLVGVFYQNQSRRWMNGYMPRLSKLRPPYRQNVVMKVHILSIQTESFVHPHSAHRQKAEKSRIRVRSESI